ncbi:MAG: cytidylate kinase, partial [Nitrospirae bacterium]
LRTPEAGHLASVFSARAPVREFLLGPQRAFAEEYDTVAEGRDMGTVVFPDAWLKFYLDASVEERAKRRYLQLKEMGKEITMEEALRDVQERDKRDSEREIAPLRRPKDAIYIDTTGISKEETLKILLKWVSSRQ